VCDCRQAARSGAALECPLLISGEDRRKGELVFESAGRRDLTDVPSQLEAEVRGDINVDGTIGLADAVYLLRWSYLGGSAPPCLDAADVNDDGQARGTSDAIFLLTWRYLGGSPPPSSGTNECSLDPTHDRLDCLSYPHCS